jgi:hypothetical protein
VATTAPAADHLRIPAAAGGHRSRLALCQPRLCRAGQALAKALPPLWRSRGPGVRRAVGTRCPGGRTGLAGQERARRRVGRRQGPAHRLAGQGRRSSPRSPCRCRGAAGDARLRRAAAGGGRQVGAGTDARIRRVKRTRPRRSGRRGRRSVPLARAVGRRGGRGRPVPGRQRHLGLARGGHLPREAGRGGASAG